MEGEGAVVPPSVLELGPPNLRFHSFPSYTAPTVPIMGSPILNVDEHNDLLYSLERDYGTDFMNSIEMNHFQEQGYEDVKVHINQQPQSRSGPPARGSFSGPYNFDANVITENHDKKQFVFSKELNRAYLCMLSELPVEFKCDRKSSELELWVRATIVLAGCDQQESRVLRCHNHRVPTDMSNRDVPPQIYPHVLRSARQSEDIIYCGDENNDQQWLSVVFPLSKSPPIGSNGHSHVYRFCCKHSCTSGINRRKIEVLFTLEDSFGEIHGRKAIGVRVCSCPKRDMEKDLTELRARDDGMPSRKRPMLVNSRMGPAFVAPQLQNNHVPDHTMYRLNCDVMGRDSYELILTVAYSTMAVKILKLPMNSPERMKCLEIMANMHTMKQNPLAVPNHQV